MSKAQVDIGRGKPLYISIAVITVLILIFYTVEVFLLAFAGILLAIAIHSLSNWVQRYVAVSYHVSLTLVLVFLLALFLLACVFIAPSVSEQTNQLFSDLPQAWNKFNKNHLTFITSNNIGSVSSLIKSQKISSLLPGLGNIFTSTFGFFGNFFIIIFLGIAFAYQAKCYHHGLIRLFPTHIQPKAKMVLEEMARTLRLWLMGKLFSIMIVGLCTWIGLWLLKIPLAFTLSFLAAILSFIPNIGPILSAIPAVLLALMVSPVSALYVIGLYIGVQILESYIVTPLVQQQSIAIPIALIVIMQLIMALLTGILGLALATPLLAVISVLYTHFYLKETHK